MADPADTTPHSSGFAPNFFIAGVQKCGTTALYSYLSQHPGVFMPAMKEPYYFATDLDMPGRITTPEQYRDLFAPAPRGTLTGEASPLYLYSKTAVRGLVTQ